jgi:anti-sigma factor RsiW
MCPDPQLLSIYIDGELPSPWKEKMETHLAGCSGCREKLENFRRLFEKNTSVLQAGEGLPIGLPKGRELMEAEIEAAKERVWRNIQSMRRFQPRAGLWQRRLSIPLPAAAAAAVVIALLAALWLRGGFAVQSSEQGARANFILAAEEEEIPGIVPIADMNGVLQYLGSDGSDIIILRLPESKNFFRSGEPAIIKAADYTRRQP